MSANADKEIVITRVIDAPLDTVWECFSDPNHLVHWWGPDGFTNTFHAFDFREGGVWDYMMHGPDGTDYPNWIRFEKIVPGKLIEYVHGENAQHPDQFHGSMRFEEQGSGTKMTLRLIFPTAEERNRIADSGAIEGGNQTLGRMAEYAETMEDSAE